MRAHLGDEGHRVGRDVRGGELSVYPSELPATVPDTLRLDHAAGRHVGYLGVAFDDADYAAMPETSKVFASRKLEDKVT